jgi:hypothetical protein
VSSASEPSDSPELPFWVSSDDQLGYIGSAQVQRSNDIALIFEH